MRAGYILLAAAVGATAANAQGPAAPAAAPAAANAAALDLQLGAMRRQFLAMQQAVMQLRRELAEEKSRSARLEQCEARNARLVDIGNELIDSYERHYRGSSFGPFKQARRRFETELQDTGDKIYRNRVDVVERKAAPQPAAQHP
jgi:hypothetical protein